MSDEIEDSTNRGTPFLQRSFVAAAVVVVVIVILGIVVAVRVARAGDAPPPPAPPSASAGSPGSASPSIEDDPAASICGLTPASDEGQLDAPPAAVWQFEGTTAYPTSQEYGPGRTAAEGYRFCYQNSVTGAVFAASNAVAQGASSDESAVAAWAQYFVSEGAGRSKILAELSQPRNTSGGVRMSIVGVRVLSYSGSTARIDLALETSGSARTVLASAVYELTWESGDWKLNSESPQPFDFSTIAGVDGYVPWKA